MKGNNDWEVKVQNFTVKGDHVLSENYKEKSNIPTQFIRRQIKARNKVSKYIQTALYIALYILNVIECLDMLSPDNTLIQGQVMNRKKYSSHPQ